MGSGDNVGSASLLHYRPIYDLWSRKGVEKAEEKNDWSDFRNFLLIVEERGETGEKKAGRTRTTSSAPLILSEMKRRDTT